MSIAKLRKSFQSLIGTDEQVFNWLNDSPHHGVYYLELSNLSEFYISQSLFSLLHYDAVADGEISELWTRVLGVPGKHTLNTIIDAAKNGDALKKSYLLSFSRLNTRPLVLKAKVFLVKKDEEPYAILLKFTRKFSKSAQIELYEDKIKRLRSFSEIYEESNELANVGGWEVDLVKEKITWTPYINKIHGVPADYRPSVESAIGFFKEGWSRDKILACFQNAVEKGESYDEEFLIISADGTEKWVRSVAKAEMKNGKCLRVYGAFQDITTAKEQELARQKAEHRFEEIFNNSSIGIALVKNVSDLVMINKAAINIFGLQHLSEEEVLNYTFADVIKPEYLQQAKEKREALIAGEIDNYKIEAEFFHSSGRVIWCSVSSSIFKDGFTDQDLIITQVEDITQQKKLEILAQKSAARFKRVFENSPNGMAVVDLHGDWVLINKNLASMVGYTSEELLELSLQQITHKDDRANDVALFSDILNKKIDSYRIEKRYVHKDGSLVHCFLTVSALYDENGHITSLIGQVVDMTETIQSKKELQKSLKDLEVLLEATEDVIIIETDLEHRITKFNKGAENLLGYTSDEVLGMVAPTLFHSEAELKRFEKSLAKEHNVTFKESDDKLFYAFNNRSQKHSEWEFKRKDGTTFIGQLIPSGVYDEFGNLKSYLAVATDISNLKEMEESLRRSKLKAEAASKSKSEFLANMSHEIRTPLNGVIGFTDLLLKTPLNENQMQYAETAFSSAVSLLDLINDILDFSKIEAGKLDLSLERVDIVEVCGRTVEMIKQAAHKKGLEILLNLPNDFDNVVLADGLRLRQILINLISNAVKFTHKGEIELKVRQFDKIDKSGKKRYRFSLRDTGIGIAPQNLKKIFRAFDQEDSSTTRRYGGTGLGLTISNKLLGLMKSNLKVESELGAGSTFSFDVDFNSVDANEQKPSIKRSLKRVLVIDDNKNNRIILEEMLKDRDIETTLVSNGIDALEILERDTNFDLAVVDYHMPYLNGIDLITHLRQELKISRSQLAIVMMHSSGHDQEISNKAKDLDIDLKLVKPVLREQLLEYLESLEQPVESVVPILVQEDPIDFNDLDLTILFAEDNPVNKFLTRTILNKVVPGAKIIEASHGKEAVEAFRSNKLDLILMDIQMPVMSGFEATAEIRKLEDGKTRIPIIALTARAIKGERERCIAQDMDDYLAKPIVLEDLKTCLARSLKEKTFN